MTPGRLHLFQGYGIELEYMIVDQQTLAVKPIADELLKHEIGEIGSDFENGIVTWSNELVMHVIEIKSTKPESNFNGIENAFAENVRQINSILAKWNAMLMPTAAHPFMNPDTDTKLWPHDNNEIYAIYDRIFNCKGHGWSNLQSMHLNLPFYDDEEFAKLHAAIRIVLPILPALCASSPILDEKLTGKLDTRLEYYKTNQSRIPSITGRVIPEAAFSKRNYTNAIYDKIKADIAPFDPENILNPIWVNSRGAMPRFDRGSIEIRVMDVQECPSADMAIIAFVTELIKALANEKFESEEKQMKIKTDTLVSIFDQTIVRGQNTIIDNLEYLNALGFNKPITAGELLKLLVEKLSSGVIDKWKPELNTILNDGNLSERIVKALNGDTSHESIQKVYRQLCGCLAQNKMFIV